MPETIEASLQLSEAVLVDIGVPMGLVIASIHEKRDEFRKILVAAGAPGARARPAGRAGGERGTAREEGRHFQSRFANSKGLRRHFQSALSRALGVRLFIVSIMLY